MAAALQQRRQLLKTEVCWMVKRIGFLWACMLIAVPVWADTLVTWQADGQIQSNHAEASFTAAPVGTPLSITLMFDPTQVSHTPFGTAGCMTVPVTASFSIGGYAYSASGAGFTHALLPGSNCTSGGVPGGDGGFTQFSLHNDLQQPDDTPWSRLSGGVLIFDYRDLLVRDAFPNEPTAQSGFASLFYTPPSGSTASWTFTGGLTFRDTEQPAPVPEPATWPLLGLGLAAVARQKRIRAKR